MLKYLAAAAVFAVCFAHPAEAQDATLPAVETMSCDQMNAEIMVAGQLMSSQMDPEFAAEAQRMNAENQAASRGQGANMVTGAVSSFACSIPGVGLSCMAAQQAQNANVQQQVAENHARMQAQHDRLQGSMTGIDQQRMMAMMDRYEQMQCQAPQ